MQSAYNHFYNPKNHLYSKPVKGLQVSEGGYRFSFNGKENDDETQTQDYGMRIYDYRLSRFLSVDPLTKSFPGWSPYPFAMNRPIDGIDLDGEEWKTKHSWKDVITDANHIKTLTASGVYYKNMTYAQLWESYSPIVLKKYVDEKLKMDCADLCYHSIIDFASQFELPIYFKGNRKENINVSFDNDRMEFATVAELSEKVRFAFGAGDLSANYGTPHTIKKDFSKIKVGDVVTWNKHDGYGFHHGQTVTGIQTEPSDYSNPIGFLKTIVKEAFGSFNSLTIKTTDGNIRGDKTVDPAYERYYSFENIKNGINSKGEQEETRIGSWNFESFDKNK